MKVVTEEEADAAIEAFMSIVDYVTITQMVRHAEVVVPYGEARVLARIYSDVGEFLGEGQNKPERDHEFATNYANHDLVEGTHAEIDAIVGCVRRGRDLKGATLYVVRVKRDGRGGPFVRGLAKPCDGCSRGIKDLGIARVVYTIDTIDTHDDDYVTDGYEVMEVT